MMTADVIVIGAGIIGSASAYYLAKKGLKVIVLEKSDIIGNGGSSRNGGGVRQSGRDPREIPIAMYGIKNLWPHLSEELGYDVEYHQDGNLRLGKTPKHLETLKKLADKASAVGLDVRMIDADEVKEINPYLSDEVIGASWCPTDGHANPLKATLAYYMAARKLGVTFITGQDVTEIKKIRGKARAVVTQDDVYEGDSIVLAAGFASRKIAGTIGIDIPMISKLIECLVTEAEPPMFNQMLGTAEADFYGHQTNHGSFVFGGSTGFEMYKKDNGTPVNYSDTVPCICRGIIRYVPQLRDAKIVRSWAGWSDNMSDGVPIIDKVDEVPGLILACGFTGHGFGIAPGVGTVISQLVTGEDPVCDISGLRYDRFYAKDVAAGKAV
jgi:sarcosine oxidase subunit beta